MKRMTLSIARLIMLGGMVVSPAALAEAPESAQACIACHGEAGNKPIANYPKLARQSEKYLLHTLKSYKNGSRPNAVMAAQLAELSDDDLAELAAYYAAQSGDLR